MRELGNVLERAAILARGATIAVADLELAASRPAAPSSAEGVVPWDEAGRRCIGAALRASGGKVHGPGGAAELLELKPTTLQTKMRKLGIDRADFVPRRR
ncbi:MAG: hypothetical protein R3F62_27655 [Planctomycetota bacterium]